MRIQISCRAVTTPSGWRGDLGVARRPRARWVRPGGVRRRVQPGGAAPLGEQRARVVQGGSAAAGVTRAARAAASPARVARPQAWRAARWASLARATTASPARTGGRRGGRNGFSDGGRAAWLARPQRWARRLRRPWRAQPRRGQDSSDGHGHALPGSLAPYFFIFFENLCSVGFGARQRQSVCRVSDKKTLDNNCFTVILFIE